jgi:hypothetical protein
MGGVKHCRLHCHLAKFRVLMIVVECSAVIGCKRPTTWKCRQIIGTIWNVSMRRSMDVFVGRLLRWIIVLVKSSAGAAGF